MPPTCSYQVTAKLPNLNLCRRSHSLGAFKNLLVRGDAYELPPTTMHNLSVRLAIFSLLFHATLQSAGSFSKLEEWFRGTDGTGERNDPHVDNQLLKQSYLHFVWFLAVKHVLLTFGAQ